MFSSTVSAGDIATATQYNNVRKDAGLFSGHDVDITYDSQGRVATIVHNDYAVTLTLTWSNAYQQITSVTDGTNTWNMSYNSSRQLTGITKV